MKTLRIITSDETPGSPRLYHEALFNDIEEIKSMSREEKGYFLEEVIKLAEKNISKSKVETIDIVIPKEKKKCFACLGTGLDNSLDKFRYNITSPNEEKCKSCNGTGYEQ